MQPNSLSEKLYRTIKTAAMAKKEEWLSSLPVIPLELRDLFREHGFSPHTAVIENFFAFLQQFITDLQDLILPENKFTAKLITYMQKMNFAIFTKRTSHSKRNTYISKEFNTCYQVWLRIDRVRKPLVTPYTRLYKVLQRHSKYLLKDIGSEKETVSIS